MTSWSDEMIEQTIVASRPGAEKLGQDFTREDAVESLNNVVALFDLLIEIDQRLRKKEVARNNGKDLLIINKKVYDQIEGDNDT